MMSDPIIGVDPGAKRTGIVARDGDRLLYHAVVTRGEFVTRDDFESLDDYADRIREAIISASLELIDTATPLLAVEQYNPPTPHLGYVDPVQISETAWLTGYLTGNADIPVPPGKHGRGYYGEYPDELITAGEKRQKAWRLLPAGRSTPVSHCRSAWDVAGAARREQRIREATA